MADEIIKFFNHEPGCKAPDYSACTCIVIVKAQRDAERDQHAENMRKLREAILEVAVPILSQMEREGADWRTRLSLWTDHMSHLDKLLMGTALKLEAILDSIPTESSATKEGKS